MSAVDLAELVAAPPGHEWHEATVDEWKAADSDKRLQVLRDDTAHLFVAVPVVPWPTTPGEYRMRRADGVVVTALFNTAGGWHWLDGDGHHQNAADDRARSLLTPVGDES